MISMVAESYAVAAIGFLILTCVPFISAHGGRHRKPLAVAAFVTFAWATAIAFGTEASKPESVWAAIVEPLRHAGWTAVLLIFLHFQPAAGAYRTLLRTPAIMAVIVFYVLFLVATFVLYALARWDTWHVTSMVVHIARVAESVLGMLLVEQLYRCTPPRKRWGIKLACLGIGMLFAYDFYLYSDALLFKQINGDIWSARGMVSALSVPLIAASVYRSSQWPERLSVSRTLVLHSAAFFGAGVYLLAMAGAGYYLRFFGGKWGTLMQIAFLVGTLLLLVVILFSGSFRAWLKVFVSKHFFHYNYDYRNEWISFTKKLSCNANGLGDAAIQAIADLIECRSGVLYIRADASAFRATASWVMSAPVEAESADTGLCRFLEEKQWVIDLAEYKAMPEKYGSLTLPRWLEGQSQVRLIVPLTLRDQLFGFILLGPPRSTLSLNWEITDLLKIAGSQVASYLAHEASSNALAVATQFESFNRMSAYVVHDIKNVVAQMSLLMANVERHKRDPRFQDDMVITIRDSVQKMNALLQRMNRRNTLDADEEVNLDELLQAVVRQMKYAEPCPVIAAADVGLFARANYERLARVVGHLAQNAVDATSKEGRISLRLFREGASAIIEFEDTGCGMTPEFIRERLFRPFVSTKESGMGIGMFESQSYVNEIGGRIAVSSAVAEGTVVRVTLPLTAAAGTAERNAA